MNPTAGRLPPGWVVLAVSGVTAAVASAWPLATYGLTLAGFGLAHVLSELRYVEGRFGPGLGPRLRWIFGLLLAGVALLRVGRIAGWVGSWGTPLELGLALALVLCAAPALARASMPRQLLGFGATLALGVGLSVDAFACILVLAILHNWTPVGFALEATSGAERRQVAVQSAVVFGAVPLLIASGVLPGLFEGVGVRAAQAAPLLNLGPVEGHFSAFLPEGWRAKSWAEHAFSAAVYAQGMHYAAVLHLLPRLHDGGPGVLSRVPRRRFVAALAGASGLFFLGFWWDFKDFRPVYGVFAAVHAWVEWPLLLGALAGSRAGQGPAAAAASTSSSAWA